MNVFDEDLKKYGYVRTSTLNNETSLGKFADKIQKEADLRRKSKVREEQTRINATKKRSCRYAKKIFTRHYGNIDCCMICGKKEHLQIHHKDKNRRNNDFTNLIKICVDCHIKMHEGEKAGEFMSRIYHKTK